MNFLQRTPFFRLLFPLIAGIICFQHLQFNLMFLVILTAILILIIVLSFFLQTSGLQFKFRWIFGFCVFLLLFLLGIFVSEQRDKNFVFQHINKKGIFRVEIIESPIEKKNSFLCRIKTLAYFDSINNMHSTKGKAIIYIAKDSTSARLKSGDILLTETIFQKPDGVLNPNGFDFATYLKRQQIGATAYLTKDSWKMSGTNNSFSIFRQAEKSQQILLDIYHRFGIKGDEFAVLAALTLGSKDALHPELRQNYTTSGGMHILAVSGLHVGVIYVVLGFLFGFLDRKPKLKILKAALIVLLLWTYAFITGLPPSVIRATLMFSLVAIGYSLERKSQIYNTISFAAFIMLIYNPDFLFDVGFQLSFSAVVSIVYFQPKIAKWIVIKNKPLRWAWDLTAVSLAAQIGTAPFSVFYFHQFPNYFLITNFIAIPFATFIIYTAVALFALSPVPYISSSIAFVLNWMLKTLNFLIGAIHDFPYSLTITSINIWQVLFVFGAIFLFALYLNNKRFQPLAGALVFILLFLSVSIYTNFRTIKTNRFVVFADNKNTHIDFIEGQNHFIFTTDSTTVENAAKSFWLSNKLNIAKNVTNEKWFLNGYADFFGKRVLILTDESLKRKKAIEPLVIDYLIVGNNQKPCIKEVLECIRPQIIIVDKSISSWYSQNIRQVCDERKILFYSVAEKGAFILNITE